jgi:hypothetical protein
MNININYANTNYGQYLQSIDPHPPSDPRPPSLEPFSNIQEQPQVQQAQPQVHYYAPQMPLLSRAIHGQTESLLYRAAEVARSALGDEAPVNANQAQPRGPVLRAQQEPRGASTVIAPIFVDNSVRMFNNQQPQVVHHHHHRGEEKKDDSGNRVLVGVIGVVVALVAAFFIGKAAAQGEEAEDEMMSFEDLKNRWSINRGCYGVNYQCQVDQVVRNSDLLLQRKEANRKQNVALVVATFAAGIIAFVGALIASKALMVGSLIFGVAIAATALYKLGYSLWSKRDQKVGHAIMNEIANLPPQLINC